LEDFERFSACYNIWKDFLPADIKTAIVVRKKYPSYHRKWGIVYLFGLLGKEPGLQWELAHAANADKTAKPTAKQEAALIRRVVISYAQACKQLGRKQETMNLTARGTGWTTMLHRMGFTSKEEVSASGSFSWRTWDAKFAASIAAVRESALELAKAEGKTPKSCEEWNALWERLEPKLCFPGCSNLSTYVKPWVFRIWTVVSLRVARVARLSPNSMSPEEFSKGYPDQSDWILRFGHGFNSMAALWNHMGYSGPPELFSMYCCFFGSRRAKEFPAAWIFANHASVVAARKGYEAGWGHESIPSVVLRLTRNSDDSLGSKTKSL
jgi:hypothetical protein